MNRTYIEFIKKDMLYIICLIICLAAIFTLSYNWKSAMEERDKYWIDEGCNTYINYMQKSGQYNYSLSIPFINMSEYENQNKNNNS